MKDTQKKSSVLIFIALAFCLTSCKKNGTGASLKQQISLRANGALYSVTTGGTGVEQSDAHIRDGNKFQLDATTSTKDFSINNQTVPGMGTYNMIGSGSLFDFVQWEDGSALFSSIGTSKSRFTFTISKVAGNSSDYVRYVEGTFAGVLYNISQSDSVIISDGVIKIIE